MGIGGSSTPSTKNVGTAFWHDLGIVTYSSGDCQLSPIFSKYSQVSFGIFSDAVSDRIELAQEGSFTA